MRHTLRYILFVSLFSCHATGDRQATSSPAGYDLSKPERFKVRESLQEISGLVYRQDEAHFIANNDEQGRLFEVDLRATKPYPNWKFGKGGDYEETVFTGKDWLVLKSNGTMHHILHLFTDTTESATYHFPTPGKREFEAAYYDSARNSVVVICKSCEEDKGQKHTSAYAFSMDSMAYLQEPVHFYDYGDIEGLKESPSKHFRPSGAAVHPIEKRVYIVASINKLLVIADMQGNVLETHPLPRRHFSQPEGITFAPNGDMYISNEGTEDNTADIMKYKYHPRTR
ncbi:hypothetical protein ACWKWU_10940 [Chitinophaga lutea]